MEHLFHRAPSSEESLSNITLPCVLYHPPLLSQEFLWLCCVGLGCFKDTDNYCKYVSMTSIKLMQASRERLTELGVFLTNDPNH